MLRLVSLVLLAVSGCASVRHASDPARESPAEYEARMAAVAARDSLWAGCYQLDIGPWTLSPTHADTSLGMRPAFDPPAKIELVARNYDGYLLVKPQPSPRAPYSTAGWRASGPNPQRDTLFLIWRASATRLFSANVSSALMATTMAGGQYRGHLSVGSDIVTQFVAPYREVTLSRTGCVAD
jgi:uncharacterized protein YceK